MPQKSVCMSMTSNAVFSGRRSPLYGQGYGLAATKRFVMSKASRVGPVDGELPRRAVERAIRRARRDHDPERDQVRRGIEEIVSGADAHGLQRRAERAR